MERYSRKDIEDIVSLTPMQEGLLFYYLQDPESDLYFEQLSLELSGEIDGGVFQQAWDWVIQANEMLRTVFHWDNVKNPVQMVLKKINFKPTYIALPDCGPEEKQRLLQEIKANDRKNKFDLREVPFRVTLCRVEDNRFEMIISNHHILYDGWSSGIILEEFFKVYNEAALGKKLLPPPLKTRFKQFVQQVQNQDAREQDGFWKTYLEDFVGGAGLPVKRSKKKTIKNTRNYCFVLPAEMKDKLDRFVKAANITTAALLYGVWGILLQHYNSSADVLYDTTVSGRPAGIKGVENIVGLFINTLPLRVQTFPNEEVGGFLNRLQRAIRERGAFENSSLVSINEYLEEYSRASLFDSVLVIENYPLDKRLMGHDNQSRLAVHSFSITPLTHYDLTAIITSFGETRFSFTYNTELFAQEIMEKLAGDIIYIMKAILENPREKIERLRLPSGDVRDRIKRLVDRGGLTGSEPGFQGEEADTGGYAAPANGVEAKLVDIWSEILRVDKRKIGTGTHFFAFGGHSLKAAMLRAKIQQVFNARVSVADIFRYPTVSALARYIAGAVEDQYTPLQQVEKKEYYRVSPAQERIYMLRQLDPGSLAYNGPVMMMLEGRIDKERLNRSFEKLIHRHESLRTAFIEQNGEPVQRVLEGVTFAIEPYPVAADGAVHAFTSFIRPFDLARAPLLRVGLAALEEEKHVLLIDLHHIITDGTSTAILTGELGNLYRGESLAPLKLQYKDFSTWVNARWESGELKRQEKYWLNHLGGELPVLEMPTDYPRPALRDYRGDRIHIKLEQDFTRRLKEFGDETGATLYMLLLAVYNILLGWYTGQEDMIIGTPVAGRNHADLQNTTGFFLETLAIRAYPLGNQSFLHFLEEIRTAALKAYENQEYPFRELVKKLAEGKNLSRNPLFDAMLNVLNQERSPLRMDGVRVIPVDIAAPVAKVDFTLEAEEKEDTVILELEYGTALFRRETMERFLRFFVNVLGAVVKNPHLRLAEIQVMNDDEKRQILEEFNENRGNYPVDQPVQELFARQVENTPDNVALVGNQLTRPVRQAHITYRELHNKSDELAGCLNRENGEPYAIAAIMVERSIEMILGILGILKTGAAYMPIDPDYPQERIDYMLKDSGAKILVSDRKNIGTINREVVVFEINQTLLRGAYNGLRKESPEPLAYIIYTSGSTGKPKGVMVNHQNLVSYLYSFAQEFKLSPDDVVLQQASVVFDAFLEEVFPPLLQGARLVIPGKETVRDTARLAGFIAKHKVTIIDCSPLLLNELNKLWAQGAGNPLATIHTYISGGDVLRGEYIDRLLQSGRVYNTYGPTETTICAAYYKLDQAKTGNVPIGKPVSNYCIYILHGKHQGVLPVGVVGEICISGPGVTRGYLNRPELTREKFYLWRPGTFLEKGSWTSKKVLLTQSPIYRTGDLARWLSNGNIEFLGRLDRQVKTRGYRIELEEIERVLLSWGEIKEAAVRVVGGHSLCAYITAREEKNLKELRDFLSWKLPHYMIPAYFVQLERMPLTAGGKIDGRALPEPGEHRLLTGSEYKPAETETEKVLLKIWRELLGLERIGIEDDFFELGGDSILVNRCLARIRDELRVEIPVVKFFERPFIKALAREVPMRANRVKSIPRASRKGKIPLSFSQERLWFLHKLDDTSAAYHVPRAIRLKGKLEVALVERTFTEIIRRNEILRTVFITVDGEPVQSILEPFPMRIPVKDLSGLDEAAREARVREMIIEEGQLPFELEKGPMMRAALLKLKEAEHLLILTEHHLVHDGWTQGVLLKEILAIFNAYAQGNPSPLPEQPIQYADFACWQRSYLQGEVLAELLEYWKEKLAGLAPVLDLPMDWPRPAEISSRGAEQRLFLDKELAAALKKFSHEQDATLFMTMLAAFKVLLYRYTGVEDLCVGTGIANRGFKELEGMLGMVINTLPLRTKMPGELSFSSCLQRVKSTCLGAYAHEHTPFEKIVEALQPERSLSYTPLFQVLYSFLDTPGERLQLPGLELEVEQSHNRSAKFDINIIVVPEVEQRGPLFDGGIEILWEYNTDIFAATTTAHLLRHYKRLLREIITRPGEKISAIPMLEESEIEQLLYDFNNTAAGYPVGKNLHGLFDERVAAAPDRVALVGQSLTHKETNGNYNRSYLSHKSHSTYMTHISYKVLNEESHGLAISLKEKGVAVDGIVALMVERSIEMIAGILGILKAGGAYMPIDPEYPQERIDYMLKDSGATVIITPGTISCLEDCTHRSNTSYLFYLSPLQLQLAYIIYTSGTTGKPKGVMIEHRNVVRLLFNDKFQFDFNERDTWTMFHSYCFDFSVWEMYGALLYGGKLIVIPRMVAREPGRYLEILTSEKVTVLNQTPSAFYHLMAEELKQGRGELRTRYVIFGGEALNPGKLSAWKSRYPVCKLINMFGITETTVHVTFKELSSTDLQENKSNIGRPIPTLSVYILDKNLGLVPPGAAGEICVGGEGLGRGYLNRVELTREKFAANPYVRGERLYRSGDLGRLMNNGELEYLGRGDQQVKIRGYRIEVGEIENQLLRQNHIKEAVVIAREDHTKDRYLCAYFVSDRELSVADLRNALARMLPAYMVPAFFIRLEKIPLTANGKVDKKALPEPGNKPGVEYAAAANEIEEKLVGIWSEVLGIDKESMSTGADFFESGGHSLKAALVMAKIRTEFNVNLPLGIIFRTPTIKELAGIIAVSVREEFLALEPVEEKEFYPPSSTQKKLYILHQLERYSTNYNISVVMELAGEPDKERLEETLSKLIRRHESLRTSFVMSDNKLIQRVQSAFSFGIVHYRAKEEDVNKLVNEFIKPFDLSRAPLFRAGLITTVEKRHILVLDMHHIIMDGASLHILREEFTVIFAGKDLTPLKCRYKDFSVWQDRELSGRKMKNQEEYWLEMYTQEAPGLKLPLDYSRPELQSFKGKWLNFELTGEQVKGLKQLALTENATLYMVILAVFNILLAEVSGQEDIVIGIPISGRQHEDLQKVIGFFINTLAQRNYPGGTKSARQFLGEVRDRSLKSFENQDYPFESLVEKVVKNRDAGRNPLFDVMFAFQALETPRGVIHGENALAWEILEDKDIKENVQFDLILYGFEAEKEDKIKFRFEYCLELFKEETIVRFIGYFKDIVGIILENPDVKLSEIVLSHGFAETSKRIIREQQGDFEF